jgi:hypothetical protein
MRSVATGSATAPRRRSAIRRVSACASGATASSAIEATSASGSIVQLTLASASRLAASVSVMPTTSATPASSRKCFHAQRPAVLNLRVSASMLSPGAC